MSSRLGRTLAALAASAVIATAVAACSNTEEVKPTQTTAPSPAPPTATEKNVKPGMGGSSFTPTVTARPAPTALPGNVNTG